MKYSTQTTDDENKSSKPTDREADKLAGLVMRVNQKCFKAFYNEGKTEAGKQFFKYSGKENHISCYAENGTRTEVVEFNDGGNYSKIFYADNGKSSEDFYYNLEKLNFNIAQQYDDNGNVLVQLTKDIFGKVKTKTINEYNELSKNILYEQHGPDDKLITRQVHKYNDRGHMIERKNTNAEDIPTYWEIYKPDEHGNSVETIIYNPDGSVKEIKTHNYQYDSKGKLIRMDDWTFPPDEQLTVDECEKDHHGNWTKMIEYDDDIPLFINTREIIYFGEQEDDNSTVISAEIKNYIAQMNEKHKKDPGGDDETEGKGVGYAPLDLEDAQWVAETSTYNNISHFRYYVAVYKNIPSTLYYWGQGIEAIALKEELKESLDARVVFTSNEIEKGTEGEYLETYNLDFPGKGYVLHALHISEVDEEYYRKPKFPLNTNISLFGYFSISPLILLRPSDASGLRDENFENELFRIIRMCTLRKIPDKPKISLVQVTANNSFYLQPYAVYDNFNIKNLELHYGYGFDKFHDELMQRFEEGTTGLVLFHGEPGTGKTYYIRHLLRQLESKNKIVIYMPPGMVDFLANPEFFTFLTSEMNELSADRKHCILLIEDAEALLVARQQEGRNQGVTNLLNMTEGLLNDVMNLQIICTFNVKLKELDPALLRPGRLIARKEFRPMPVLDANLLAQQLGIKHHFIRPTTIAEVFALLQNKQILVHGEGKSDAEEE